MSEHPALFTAIHKDTAELQHELLPFDADLEDLYENSPCGCLSLGPDGGVVKSDLTLSGWIEYPREELLGGMCPVDLSKQRLGQLWPHLHADAVGAGRGHVARGRRRHAGKRRNRRPRR